MIDTHCHLYSSEFDSDRTEMIQRAEAAGVNKFYLPAIDSGTHDAMISLADEYAGKCFAMIGLHPCSVNAGYARELEIIEQWLSERKFSAIGETGLDFYWDKTFVEQQYLALEHQIRLALQYDLPLVLHTRDAMQETIDIIKKYRDTSLNGIFHCFGGTPDQAKQITDAGFLLGIGGVVTYKNSGLAEVLKHLDLQHLVLETDAPYLAPVPMRGKRNESSYLGYIVKKIAEAKEITEEEVIAATTANAEKLFG
ncbi:TatD family hydrolase [Ferruginibacter sp. HRS2-29]|uniref:TatD family hydrolase n=1 Tax=Ferruginibacter sp. HRS2-29 TaxID=2487334 RepID=UPI0020CD91C1|nr:TatD family hydrolase [Ferruginibacter sp. HRS2-29]MCP9751665.1 TatD family deoxyribonuclease [Ferruginibacter sp. HRS2-29]